MATKSPVFYSMAKNMGAASLIEHTTEKDLATFGMRVVPLSYIQKKTTHNNGICQQKIYTKKYTKSMSTCSCHWHFTDTDKVNVTINVIVTYYRFQYTSFTILSKKFIASENSLCLLFAANAACQLNQICISDLAN